MKNREIKFRIRSDIFSDWVFTEDHHNGNAGLFLRWHNQYINNPEFNPVICQFTGLHDKNGKEIYEGDIVSLAGFSVDSKYMDLLSGYVLFFNGSFSVKENDNGYYLSTVHETCTVIGNVHQHPELLK